jgi:hypothetical protein
MAAFFFNSVENPPKRDPCHGRPWSVLATPDYSQEEVAMKELLIIAVVRFAALVVPVAVIYFVH